MVTDEQRREVAAKIRELYRLHPDEYLDVTIARAMRTVLGYDSALPYALAFADLIDRQTCSMNPIENSIGMVDFVYCSDCKETFRAWEVEDFRYCPSCGAEVVDEDSAN